MGSRRDEWRKVLDGEVERWEAMSAERLLSELSGDPLVYEVEADSKTYQVEVEILENTGDYVHVMISVDDGTLPASILPAAETLIVRKSPGLESRSTKSTE